MLCKYSVHVLSLWGTEFQDGALRVDTCPVTYGCFQRASAGATYYQSRQGNEVSQSSSENIEELFVLQRMSISQTLEMVKQMYQLTGMYNVLLYTSKMQEDQLYIYT